MQKRLRLTLGSILLAATAAWSQTSSSRPSFDVASIRPSPPLDMGKLAASMQAGQMPRFGAHIDGSRAEYTYMSLKDLVANAYGVKPYQVSGPDWLASDRYDISAKMPEGSADDDAPHMLQALLMDRFHLVGHRDTQEHPVTALVVAKGGPHLKDAPPPEAPIDPDTPLKPNETKLDTPNGPARMTRNPDGSATVNMGAKGTFTQRMDGQILHMQASSVTMEGFADMLTSMLRMGSGGGRQVVDMTGLKGNYQVAIDLSIADLIANARAQGMDIPAPPPPSRPANAASDTSAIPNASDPGGSTIYTSVEALGLKLENRKAPVEQIVIDRIEKTPTEN
jgi:uncharacterized protein (TIGR03435 family)